jgi:hypothetical protein
MRGIGRMVSQMLINIGGFYRWAEQPLTLFALDKPSFYENSQGVAVTASNNLARSISIREWSMAERG